MSNLLKRYFGSGPARRAAWSKHLERLAEREGLLMYRPHLNWAITGPIPELGRRWGTAPGMPLDRGQLLYELGIWLRERGVPGSTAECGVYHGKGSFFLLSGLADPKRPHHLFDSFAGLPAPAEQDRASTRAKGGWKPGELFAAEAGTRQRLSGFPQCVFHPGWIPATFSELGDERFAFVHVDVDLYEPTLASFAFFYPRLSSGGAMVCDDYGFSSCPGSTQAVDEFFRDKTERVLRLASGQALIIKD